MKEKHTDLKYIVILIIGALIICSMSKNSLISNGVPLTDSSVFQFIGYRMWKYGEIPYLNFFDHKGPAIYLINMLGTFLSLRYGIFFIEILFMFVTLYFSWKTLILFNERIPALIADILCFGFLYDFFECGNLVEEYSMAFMAISIYLFSIYYKTGKTNACQIIVSGMCFSAVLLLRPNMIGVWVVFCCAIALKELLQRNGWLVLKMVSLFILGCAIIFIPTVLYLLWNHVIESFWDCYIIFNFAYSGSAEGSFLYSLFCYIKTEFFVTTVICWCVSACLIKNVKWLQEYFAVCAVAFGISLFLCCLSGNPVPHYLMTVFPIAVIGYSSALDGFLKWAGAISRNMKVTAGIFLMLILAIQVQNIGGACVKYQSDGDFTVQKIAEVVRDNSSMQDSITVYGNACKYYLTSDRGSVSRYIYQYPIGNVRPSIMEEYFDDLEVKKPVMVIIDHTFDMGENSNAKMERLLKDYYDQLYNDEYAAVWKIREE